MKVWKGLGLAASVALGCWIAPHAVHAQTGVSDNRVSLPDGPGSQEGLGDDADVGGNTGAMTYGTRMPVPAGFAGVTPTMGLSYSSAGGPGIAGAGWSMPMPSIERLTMRGVPTYDVDDVFTSDGGELVYVGGTNPREYRARFEGSFVRYRWYDPGDGTGGHWTAEYPDGRVGTFGATSDGRDVDAARVGGEPGVFRYHLVDVTDVWGHQMRYAWTDAGHTALLESIEWLHVDDEPQYRLSFSYEPREDVVIDATGGFVERLEHRLTDVEVTSFGDLVDRWTLTYDRYDDAGGRSRLARVDRFGSDGTRFPVATTYAYSASLGTLCDDGDCQRPYVRGLGNLGVNLASGDPQLIDINGDALPDIVDSTLAGAPHRVFINRLDADGRQVFDTPYDSRIGRQDGFDFSNGRVQVLDVNGDGFSDAVNMATGRFLLNRGTGDWAGQSAAWSGSGALPDFDNPALMQTMRFVDIDNDRRIDVLRASGSGASHLTQVYRNTGAGYELADGARPVGLGFDAGTMEVNDINGDGLVDVAQVTTSAVRYRLSLGHGRWWPADGWAEAPFTDEGLTAAEIGPAELEDVDGDGLADLVLVRGATVELWMNRAGERMERFGAITNDDVDIILGAAIPTRTATTTVLLADVNANGSSDVVWVTESGEVTALELFPVRPNLLTRVDNGQGVVLHAEYGTSVEQQVRDRDAGAPWPNAMPFANQLVTAMWTDDGVHGPGWRTDFAYHDGFYDGVEKQFRGYARVVRTHAGDEWQIGAIETELYDVGEEDPYRAGTLLQSSITTADGTPIQTNRTEYDDCPVDVEAAAGPYPIRHWCAVAMDTIEQEGADPSAWRTVRSEFVWDAYGQQVTTANLGVVAIGDSDDCGVCEGPSGSSGAPCGAGCLGDESYTDITFIEPGEATGGAWILGRPARVVSWGDADRTDLADETELFYDGDAFEGLPAGQLTRGAVTRRRGRVDASRWIDQSRVRFDANGNVIESWTGEAGEGVEGQRTLSRYDETGLRLVEVDQIVDGTTTLRQTWEYEPLRGQLQTTTDWARVGTADPLLETRYTYDAFGRVDRAMFPGDSPIEPAVEHRYFVDRNGTRIESRMHRDGAPPLLEVRCLDGYGRGIASRTSLGDGTWRIRGRTAYGRQGQPVIQGFETTSDVDGCAAEPLDASPRIETTFDAIGRAVRLHTVGADGLERTSEAVYAPGRVEAWSPTDLDPDHVEFETPEVRTFDGLGRLTAVGRRADRGEVMDWWRMGYDASSNLTAIENPLGGTRRQHFDLLSRIVEVRDASRGTLHWTYDDTGAMTSESNPTGTIRYAHDGAGRLVEQWTEGAEELHHQRFVWDADPACPDARCTFSANRVVAVEYATPLGTFTDWSGYDRRGRVIWVQRDTPDGSLERTWTFDRTGSLLSMTLPGQRSIEIEYDAAARITALPGYVDAIALTDRGAVDRLTYTNGQTLQMQRDGHERVTRVQLLDGATPRVERTFAYDDRDRLVGMGTGAPGMAGFYGAAEYGHDGMGRLIEARLGLGTDDEETVTYAYDAIDNLIRRESSLGEASPVHDGRRAIDGARPRAVAEWQGRAITYDDSGRTTAIGDERFAWDASGRMVSATAPDGGVARYGYLEQQRILELDADGAWVLQFGPDFELRDGVATYFPRLGDVSIARHTWVDAPAVLAVDATGDGAIRAGDAWLLQAAERGFDGVDVDPTTEGAMDRTLNAAAAMGLDSFGDRVTWQVRDHLDTLIAVTDESGDVIEHMDHYPFGVLRSSTSTEEPRRFSDEPTMRSTGMVRIGLRDYDPRLGRWLQPDFLYRTIEASELEDPWEALGDYSYVQNAPLDLHDPTGATSEELRASMLVELSETWVAAKRSGTRTLSGSAANTVGMLLALVNDTGQVQQMTPAERYRDLNRFMLNQARQIANTLAEYANTQTGAAQERTRAQVTILAETATAVEARVSMLRSDAFIGDTFGGYPFAPYSGPAMVTAANYDCVCDRAMRALDKAANGYTPNAPGPESVRTVPDNGPNSAPPIDTVATDRSGATTLSSVASFLASEHAATQAAASNDSSSQSRRRLWGRGRNKR